MRCRYILRWFRCRRSHSWRRDGDGLQCSGRASMDPSVPAYFLHGLCQSQSGQLQDIREGSQVDLILIHLLAQTRAHWFQAAKSETSVLHRGYHHPLHRLRPPVVITPCNYLAHPSIQRPSTWSVVSSHTHHKVFANTRWTFPTGDWWVCPRLYVYTFIRIKTILSSNSVHIDSEMFVTSKFRHSTSNFSENEMFATSKFRHSTSNFSENLPILLNSTWLQAH